MSEFKFDNNIYKFEKVIRNSEWNFYESNHSFTEKITIALKEVELKLIDNIVVVGNKKENSYGTTIWADYQKVDTQSVEYFKCILSEIKGLTQTRIDDIFEEYNFKSQTDFIEYFEKGGKIRGIGPKKIKLIKSKLETVEEENKVAELAISLDNYKYAAKIISKCHSLSMFFETPYKWLSTLHLGFQKTDEIARNKLNITLDNKERNEFLTEWKFKQFNIKNSNFVSYKEFREYLLNEVKYINKDVDTYIKDNDLLIVDGDNVYLKEIYEAEKNTPTKLLEYSMKDCIDITKENITIFDDFVNSFNSNNFTLHESQSKAIKEIVFGSNVSLLTGGAGTGKSTVTKAIVECLRMFGYSSTLLAPTGKAALRMTECIRREATTVHSVIASEEYLDSEILSKKFGDTSKTILIIDEASMLSQSLFYDFLQAISKLKQYCPYEKVLLIGDRYQLPSVGSGQVLDDLIDSKLFTHVNLTKTFRQDGKSLILENANKVRYKKEIPLIKNNPEFYISGMSDDKIKKIFFKFKDKYANNIEFYKNFQICVTTNKMKDQINEMFKIPNTDLDFKSKFQVGDKVINTKNDKERCLTNGDMGIVQNVEKSKTTIFFYDNKHMLTIENNLLKNIDFAYACTTHKLQGSEYKSVMFLLQNNPICDHRLFYTAITRAKINFIVLANNYSEITTVCKKSNDYMRRTNFKTRLKKEFKVMKI